MDTMMKKKEGTRPGISMEGGAYGINEAEDVAKRGLREEVFAKMFMRQLGMSREEALEFIKKKGIDNIAKMFGGAQDTDVLEKRFDTLKSQMRQHNKSIEELDEY